MKNNIFLPKTIRVGCQKREGTYTGKLAYIIYIDQKGKVRKETSWEQWRDTTIEPEDWYNVPTGGFVLNKKVGGDSWSGWNHRQTYCRVYDPRGFEFEINVENLLYVLENTSSIKGKGLEGEFVYGWSGTELILIPTSSSDYVELASFNEVLHDQKKFKGTDMIVSATYQTKDNNELVYMGRFDYFEYSWRDEKCNPKGKMYFFSTLDGESMVFVKTLSAKIISCVSEECVSNFTDLFDALEGCKNYSPIDTTKDVQVPYPVEEFKELFDHCWSRVTPFVSVTTELYRASEPINYNREISKLSQYSYNFSRWGGSWDSPRKRNDIVLGTFEEFVENYKPYYINRHLVNGKFYKRINQK